MTDPAPADAPTESPGLVPADARALRRLLPWMLWAVALLVVGYVTFNGIDGLLRRNSLDAQITATRGEIAGLEWQAEQLSALVAYLDSDEYVERVAREDLGLVRPGEEAFAVEAPARRGLRIVRTPWWANLLPAPQARAIHQIDSHQGG